MIRPLEYHLFSSKALPKLPRSIRIQITPDHEYITIRMDQTHPYPYNVYF